MSQLLLLGGRLKLDFMRWHPRLTFLPILFLFALAFSTQASPSVIIVVGAPGEAQFGSNFVQQAALWQQACLKSHRDFLLIGQEEEHGTNDYSLLKQALDSQSRDAVEPLWLVMIGHGTFDGKEGRFNLRGPDVSASELGDWLKPFHRPLIVLDTTSCSAPFLNKLSGTNRVVITATRSGNEQYFTRFGLFLVQAITNPEADLDKDEQVSLLEAFLMASRQTAEFYKTEGRLATEHALLDDNGDGLGTPADWFQGLRAIKAPSSKAQVDGYFARQVHFLAGGEDNKLTDEERARRDSLERAVFALRDKKVTLKEEDYYGQLEKLLLELARLDAQISNRIAQH